MDFVFRFLMRFMITLHISPFFAFFAADKKCEQNKQQSTPVVVFNAEGPQVWTPGTFSH